MSPKDSNKNSDESILPDELSDTKKKERANKDHYSKKEQNNKLFNEICHRVFQEKLNAHYNILEFIKYQTRLAEDALSKEIKKIIEDEFLNSILNYNESVKNSQSNMGANLVDVDTKNMLDTLIKNISNSISKLTDYLNILDKKINDTSKKISEIKIQIADEMKNIFTVQNEDIIFSEHSLTLPLPSIVRHETGTHRLPEHLTLNIDKELYIEYVNLFAERLPTELTNFNDIKTQADDVAMQFIKNQIEKLVINSPFIPAHLRGEVVHKMLEQPNVIKEYKHLASKMLIDISKQEKLTHLTSEGIKNELDLINIQSERTLVSSRLNNLNACLHNATQLGSLSISDPAQLRQAVAQIENCIHAAENIQTKASSRTESIATETNKLSDTLDSIKDDAKTELLLEKSATSKEPFVTKINQAVETHEAFCESSLEDMLKGYMGETPTVQAEPAAPTLR